MTAARIRLILAALAFFGWLTYLATAVIWHRTNPPTIVSRSQLIAATHVVLADVTLGNDGLPQPQVTIAREFNPTAEALTGTVTVTNLPSAQTPEGTALQAGQHLLLLVERSGITTEGKQFAIAGWPRSPAMPSRNPGDPIGENSRIRRPVVYPWNTTVEVQLTQLGYR